VANPKTTLPLGRSRFGSDGTIASSKDVERIPLHCFSRLVIHHFLSSVTEVFFARTMHSTSGIRYVSEQVCVIQLDDRRSHLGTSELTTVHDRAIWNFWGDSCASLVPAWVFDGCFWSWSKSNYWNVSSAVLCTKVSTSEPQRFTAISKHHGTELFCVLSWKCP